MAVVPGTYTSHDATPEATPAEDKHVRATEAEAVAPPRPKAQARTTYHSDPALGSYATGSGRDGEGASGLGRHLAKAEKSARAEGKALKESAPSE